MKRLSLAIISALFIACGGNKPAPEPEPEPTPEPSTPDSEAQTPAFARGADISWVTEMEKGGVKFKKKDGTQADILTVLKDCGMNAIRLRVWVNPYNGWSGKDDVVALAKRVKAAGMALMVDFHYSDFFADPSRQQIPAAWKADEGDLAKMCQHVSAHTKEVLQALKDAGVTVSWVQIGNETRNGMLWSAGQLWTSGGNIPDGRKHFAALYNAGYDAAKAVFSSAVVMPHLDNAYEDNLWWFREIKAEGGKFDAIALSHYPQASSAATNAAAIAQIKQLRSSLGLPIFVSEVGVKPSRSDAAAVLAEFMTSFKALEGAAGIFYWEPQVYGGWKPAVYSDAAAIEKFTGKRETWNAYDMGAFAADGRPSAILDAFKQ